MHIATHTGRLLDPDATTAADIDIRDIAHSLALQCRFNGHCRRFYSVAQHSVLVSLHVPAEDALWGLLHDAAEAYIGDIIAPIKGRLIWRDTETQALRSIHSAERRILAAIAERFALPTEMPESVRLADERMLATERRDLWPANHPEWPGLAEIKPYSSAINEWPNPEERFLAQYGMLTRDWE